MFFSRLLCVTGAFSRNNYALGHHKSAEIQKWPGTVITFLDRVLGRSKSENGRQKCSNSPEIETEYRQTAQENKAPESLRSLSARRVCSYTVDFHWGDYTYSIAGESEITLSALLEKLGVTEITAADVTEVAFSDPALVEVETIKNEAEQTTDWLLRSRAPFQTDEKLTLTLKNGETVEIKVTDEVTLPKSGDWTNGTKGSGTWEIDTNGILTISGTGEMPNYSAPGNTPWGQLGMDVRNEIKSVVFKEGITHLGNNMLTRSYNMVSVDASKCTTLKTVGTDLFKGTRWDPEPAGSSLESINFSGCNQLTTIGKQAFRATKLETVDFSGCSQLNSFGDNCFADCTQIKTLNISGTKLKPSHITTTGAGFGSSKNALEILRANGCTTDFTTLDLTGWNSLQTVELSGCTNLTGLNLPTNITNLDLSGCTGMTSLDASGCAGLTTLDVSGLTGLTELTVPSGITTLDISGCTGLESLDLSSCTALTTVKVGDRSDLTDLTWLTLPDSVTTLDASGFTSLTSIAVPASVTSLDVSGCTGLTALDLSGTSLTSIDVSDNASLTTLKLPASVTNLDLTNCGENLVLYFDGTSAGLPKGLIPEGVPAVCWGDYSYPIARGAELTLDEIFAELGITAFGSDAVQSVSSSDADALQVDEDLKIINLKPFTEPLTLTLTLKNGITGTIGVTLAALEESSNLNGFLDAETVYGIGDEAGTYAISEPAIIKEDDVVHLTLSFSEIPEGQEGERQMALLAPMTYTFPAGLTVSDIPETVTLSVRSGEQTYTFPASVAFSAETGVLTVTGIYGDQEAVVQASTMVEFTLPVTVQPDEIPGEYALGSDISLSVDKPHNVKVSMAAEEYDSDSGTVRYTVIVTAENDIDLDGEEYPVTISDITAGDSPNLQFVSGSYTYAQESVPEGAPATQIGETEVTPGIPTDFTQLPLTVTHMYNGDTVTLIYTARVLKGIYDKDAQQASVQNTVTISCGNPTNKTEDDTASVTTENIPYIPLTRKYVTLDGSWAYWEVTVNPDGYTLNDDSSLTLADTFDDGLELDAKQSIDYSSVTITSNGAVSYDYSGSTGTFVIPDNTPVTITYRTRITAEPGEAKTFRGTARLRDTDGNQIASATAGVTEEPVAIYPSASDVDGSGNYMVKLFVYGDREMQRGIEGASFILLDANQRPLEYKVGANKDQPITFITGSNGYVNIELHEEEGDVSIEKNTGYYLEMMQAVEGYQKDNTLYSFMITDDPSYNTGGFYQYYNGDTMKVRLYPVTEQTPRLSVSIRFSGSYALREDQMNAVTAVLQKLDDTNNWVTVERHPYTDTQWGTITFSEKLYDESLGEYQNIYRVVEENENPWDLPEYIHLETNYYFTINTDPAEPETESKEFSAESADDVVSIVIDNRYEDPQLTIVKMDKQTGEVLPGAVFSVYRIVNGEAVGDAVTDYTTDVSGELIIRGGGSYESETLYGIKETQAPELEEQDTHTTVHYLLPVHEEWHYFYFCNDDYLEPSILANLPEGATAVNLTSNGDRITVDNQKEIITVPVMKLWQGTQWPGNSEVVIGLYWSVAGGDAEPVRNTDGTPRQVTLNSTMPYNNTAFKNLPSRDEEGRNITYSIKEEYINGIVPPEEGSEGVAPLDAGYIQEYGISSAGVYIVRNKPATTLTVNKEWYEWNDAPVTDPDTLAAQSPVTFDVYRSSAPFEDGTPEDDITNEDVMDFVSGLTKVRENQSFGHPDWSMSICDLDKQDDLGNRYYYYVLETVPSFGSEIYAVNDETGTVTIKNRIAPEVVNLTVTKAPLVDDPRLESLDRDFEFTLKLYNDRHPIRSWQVYTDTADPEKNLVTDWNGEVKFKLKPTNPEQQPTEGASVTLDLPAGVKAAITETFNAEYTVEAGATIEGSTSVDGRIFSFDTDALSEDGNSSLTYTNTLHVICKVVKADETLPAEERQVPFESLKSALKYIRDHGDDFTSPWTIYMLEDYSIPVTDAIISAEGENLTLTTASTDDPLFPFKGGEETDRAVITRGEACGSMFKNAGTLTLENICLDGAKGSFTAAGDGGLVSSTGTLNLNADTALRNSAAAGKGGAVYAEGTVNIADGAEITGNSAHNASALYLNGTLNMRGGSISGNIGASDGAVVAESVSDLINLSGNTVIFGNTNAQGKAANLFIGIDSDNTVNVVAPGLSEDAHIGVSAMEGHMAIGEQFATAEFEQTDNLNRFVNDAYGYRGKLKDGTTTNIVWDGLTIKIKKVVDPLGANPNDRFTITLSSMSIVLSTYVIDGTLDYTITPARLNRPGRIILRNVKAEDEITISPLPVAEYTVAEEESNYTPRYTIVETGSSEDPTVIENGIFSAENSSTVTVTNTRRLATVKLTKTLDDRLTGDTPVGFDFTVKLTEADGNPVQDFALAEDVVTGTNGEASFTMLPTDALDFVRSFEVPVGVIMTITETVNPNYGISVTAETMPEEGEAEVIADLDEDHDNVFAFRVTDDGADVIFGNTRKLVEIELSKTLTGKVSKTEAFTFTLTLKNQDDSAVANYEVYRDETDPDNSITTNGEGAAEITLSFGENETTPKSIPLTIPEGTKLTVAETNANGHADFYDTSYSVNGAAAKTGTAAIDSVSETDRSIAFTNSRKMNTIVVKNTVKGYSGNVVPFTYTATVTDGGENQDDYDLNGFTDGVITFELTTEQTQTLTVPYGATLTVAETFIVGYSTTVKRGSNNAREALSDTFVVTVNITSSAPLLFTNSQLIGLRIVNNTSSTLENVTVTVDKNNIYLVNEDQTGQERISTNKTATISVDAGKTAILEIQHDTSVTAEQNYSVKGITPTVGYYYTIHNEPSFHETANPAILRVYDAASYEVKGKLRYSVQDSTVTFTEQPLVSFDSNGGTWTTDMDGYRDRDGDRRVYQKAVDRGAAVERPESDPVYPTAEGIVFLGWTVDKEYADQDHSTDTAINPEKAYDFSAPVNEPITLYAVWAKPARDERVVTVKNGHNETLSVTVTLSQGNAPTGSYTLADDLTTDENGQATFDLGAGESKNLTVPDGAKLVLSLESASLAVSSEYALTASGDNKSFTIGSVERDGTVTFIPGVCKITDSDGNVLYDNNGNPAVYGTLAAAFTAYAGTLYTDASHSTAATQAAVKMLVDEYTIQQSTALTFPNKTMTLTTAGKTDTDFPYMGERDRSTIYRASNGVDNSCFTFANGTVTLTDIILDGRSERGVKVNDGKNGALINVTGAGATLNISTGATLRNVEYKAYTSNANGGAVYMTNGTLNVNAGLFSNLHAYQGGAICVTGGTLNVTGTAGSTQFEDCRSERQDGGAIYYNREKDVVIDGGTDKNNAGIIFTRCVAAYTNGTGDGSDGGAIFATSNYKNTVTVKGCAFVECSARTGNGSSTAGYGGGGICAYKVKGLTVEACTFDTCDTLCGGGAVAAMVKYTETVDNETVTVTNCSFNQCNCKGQAGALGVYQDDNGKTNSATKLSIIGSSFTGCSSGTNNGSGGAIQCYLPCMVFTDSSFTDCWAGKEGGAVNNFFGSNYTQEWSKSYMTVTDCSFIRCRAEDRYDTTALQHYGGGINTKAKTVTVTGSYFEDCVSTLREGGALHIGGQGTNSKATITGSTFKNCTAKNGGGAVLSSHETLTIGNSHFYGCGSSASNGGAVYHYQNSRGTSTQKYLTITDCTFGKDPENAESLGCSATQNGGAIWTRATTDVTLNNLTIQNAIAGGNGGGVYLDTGVAKATLTGGSITDCQAVSGSAVYVGKTATFSGNLSVSGNTVSTLNSGAIQTVDAGKLYFEGNVKVENNTSSADTVNNHDVLMHINGNTIINTTSVGLGAGAHIGVYVSDPNSAYANHGLYEQPFGTYYNSDAGTSFLDAFFNNRDSLLYGYQGTDAYIHWGYYVCKITDADGNTLKRPNGRDAVYQRLSQAFDEFTTVKDDNGETGKAVYIKMLVEDYAIRQEDAISNFPAANITLTTASRSDTKHPYRGTEGTVSTIYRTNSENPLFSLSNANAVFQLKDITLNGRKSKTATEGAYKLITASTGEIVVNSGTTLQYAKGDTGAAITGVKVTINGSYDAEKKAPTVKIINCTATGNGGAISTQDLTITNNGEKPGEYGTAFTNCSSGAGGGAIHAAGTAVSMAGASFTDCRSTGDGGVLFHGNNAATAATEITDCSFTNDYTDNGAGGAVSSNAATLTVNGSSFDTVRAAGNGGAISHTGTEGTTISASSFKACRTTGTGFGGSVYTAAKTVSVEKNSFKDSTAANHGGALYCAGSAEGSAATVSGTSFENCTTTLSNGNGGAIYANGGTLMLKDADDKTVTKIDSCKTSTTDGAVGRGGAVYMNAGALTVTDNTAISGCFANLGGAVYLPADVTMNISGSPEFSQNGFTTKGNAIIEAENGACIYLVEGSRINFEGSPKFSRNILPNLPRIPNGGVADFVRQDVYLAGYENKSAASIYVVGELAGDTIWVWPEKSPHKLANEQFAKIENGVAVNDETLSHFRNALSDAETDCTNGEYLAGVQVGMDTENVYWDKMYLVDFKKKDNKGVSVPGAVFTLYRDLACTQSVATAKSADGENDTDAQGKLLARGTVEFTSIRIGAYYMKETTIPLSFKENSTTYIVLVGTPYLSPNEHNRSLWEGDGPLNVTDAATLVARHTTDAGKFYGIFPLDEYNKAVLRANIASSNVGIENIRNDYQVSFMKEDGDGMALPGAAFTIYTQMLDSEGQPDTFEDGYPKLMRWSRDGETYPDPVESADGTARYKDKNNRTLPKGVVYFRELPLGTYFLLETAYPERSGSGHRAFYVESDRVFKLEITEKEDDPTNVIVTLSEWKPTEEDSEHYDKLEFDGEYYVVSNREVVCKLTDANNNLLYTQGHKVWENKESESNRLFPAIYPELEEGFETAQTGSFVDKDGNPVSEKDISDLMLQVLKDYTLEKAVVYSNSSRKLTFTTAPTTINPRSGKHSKDRYIFSTTRTSDTSRALVNRGYSAADSSGALITITDGANLSVQNIILNGQKSRFSGRAFHVEDGKLNILAEQQYQERTLFEDFAVNADGSIDAKGGAILMDDDTSLTIDGGYNRAVVFSQNEVANAITDGDYTGADGGAIAVGANCTFRITNAQFNNNHAISSTAKKGNGGAISINRTKNADEMMDLPISNVVFSGNRASYQGGAIRAAENCSLTVENCTFSNNRANTFTGQTDAPGEGGAIAVLSKQDNPSTLTISGGSFTGNSAAGSKGGAVKIGGFGTLVLKDSPTISGNTAAYGGAVTAAPGTRVTMESGTIRSNTASADGGAFYVEGKRTSSTETTEEGDKEVIVTESGSLTVSGGTVTGNSAVNGGAVYAANYAAVTVSGGSVTSNTASLGSAIYAADYAAATVTNAGITGNTASGTNGGAINAGGRNARLYFGGTPTVFDNFGALGKNQQMNLVLSEDSNEVINTTPEGLVDGVIGVFVIESDNTVFENHGLPGKPFGTFGDTTTRFNPQVFRSDHALSLYGVRNDDYTSDTLIYWVDVICKLTDADDKILYQDISLNINGVKQTRKAQAVYARITDYDDPKNPNAVANGFNALRDGFDAAQGTLYYNDGTSFNDNLVKLKMLRDYDIDKSIRYLGSRMVTFTTAELQADMTEEMKGWGDYFWFKTDRTGVDGRALITRAFADDSMIVAEGTRLTLTDITLDGAKNSYSANVDGGIVSVASDKELRIETGATLQNSKTTANGGAVYVSTRANATFSGGTINGNTAARGAGFYLAWDNANNHAILNLTGEPSFGGTDRVGGDGTDKDDLKGTEGNFVRMDSSFKTEDKEPTNGGKQYPKDSEGYYLVRQDIYIHDIATPHNAIRVTGAITSDDGTIWVWAENADHYEMLKQFAVFDGDGIGMSDARKENSMKAFRNAQPDSLTNCGGDYLTGQKGEQENWIYWTGGFDVVLRKIDSFGRDMNGATFTLYKSNDAGLPTTEAYQRSVNGTMQDITAVSRVIESDNAVTIRIKNGDNAESRMVYGNALVVFEKIPVGTYYVRETSVSINGEDRTADYRTVEDQYKLVIDKSGWYTLSVPIHNTNGTITWLPAESLQTAPTTLFVRGTDNKYTETTAAVGAGADTLAVYTLLNVPKTERKVILRKVLVNSNNPLSGAQFRIFSVDMSEVIRKPDYNETIRAYQSQSSGVYFVGKLPAGTYYLVETRAPDGASAANTGKVFKLTVNTDGSTTLPAVLGTIDVSEEDKVLDNLKHQAPAW